MTVVLIKAIRLTYVKFKMFGYEFMEREREKVKTLQYVYIFV